MSGSSVYPIAVLAPPSLVVICACIEAVILASLHFLAVLTLVVTRKSASALAVACPTVLNYSG